MCAMSTDSPLPADQRKRGAPAGRGRAAGRGIKAVRLVGVAGRTDVAGGAAPRCTGDDRLAHHIDPNRVLPGEDPGRRLHSLRMPVPEPVLPLRYENTCALFSYSAIVLGAIAGALKEMEDPVQPPVGSLDLAVGRPAD